MKQKKLQLLFLDDYDSSNIKVLGWPRVDLWQPSMNKIWSDQIKDIKKNFQNHLFYLLLILDAIQKVY